VTELTVVIFFRHAAVLNAKTAFNSVKIHLYKRKIKINKQKGNKKKKINKKNLKKIYTTVWFCI
jgi:uncharacterized protein Veg